MKQFPGCDPAFLSHVSQKWVRLDKGAAEIKTDVTLDKGLKSLSKEITDNSKSHCSPHPSNPFNSQYSSSFGYSYGGWNFKNSVKFLQRNIPSKVFLRSLGKPSYKIEAEAGLRRGT